MFREVLQDVTMAGLWIAPTSQPFSFDFMEIVYKLTI
jgi:hypothetical protein